MYNGLRMAGLVLVLGFVLGLGYWQQHGLAAGQAGKGLEQAGHKLKQLFAPAMAGKVFSPAPRSAPATTITVTSLGDGATTPANCPGANCRLRDALAKAVAGDTIDFAVTGTIAGFYQDGFRLDKNLTINGPGAAQLTITFAGRTVISISSGVTATITGLRVADSSISASGGGIFNFGNLALTNCTIANNRAVNGGGIVNAGALTITDCLLSDNRSVPGSGGAISNNPGATLTLINSTLSGNLTEGERGGGIYNRGELTVSNCTISDNFSIKTGGGIHNEGTLTLTQSTLYNNLSSYEGGGGIHNTGSMTINQSTLTGNRSHIAAGGGLENYGTATITNSTLSGNSAYNLGGGIYVQDGALTLINCTLTGNIAGRADGTIPGFGGGIRIAGSGSISARNTLIAGNIATANGPDVMGTLISLGHNLIGSTRGATITGETTGNLLNVNPLLAFSLGNYGGPTQMYALLPGSPAIQAGDNCVLTDNCASDNLGFNLTTDQRGAGFNRQVGSAVDIGAFESRGFTLALASGNNQSTAVNTAFTNPLSVTVTASGAGEPVCGGEVSFTPPGSGASATLAGNPATINCSIATTETVTANGTAGGPYNVVASATGATVAVNFALTNLPPANALPTIQAGAGLTRQQGTAGSIATIATVNDSETPVGSLIVTATTVPTGITVTSITNTAGTITANVTAGCTAAVGANTVVLTVTDGNAQTATANLTVNVTANTAPTLTYSAVSVNAGGATSNSPTTATDNVSITGYAVQSQGTYTGTLAVNAAGVVSFGNAGPVGLHTITIRATDNCGAHTDAMFTLTVGNNAPTITAGATLTRQRGSAGTVGTLATVSDSETPVGSLAVTATTVPAGITVTSITNTAGTITANVAAGCTAVLGANTVVLTVTDGNGGTATANLTVNVTANTAPVLTYGAVSVSAGGSTSNNPTSATDNGSITGYAVQSPGTYTGTISVNASGVVSLNNAAPVGMHTLTIRATDNCGVTTDATFMLNVGNNPPMITAGAALTHLQGAGGALATLATVSDSETPAGNLVVVATTVPTGITVTSLSNTAGTVTANVAAGCNAMVGANTVVLTVTDSNSGTATANLTVNVTAAPAPSINTPPAGQTVCAGSPATLSVTAANALGYQWRKGGNPINGATASSFTIPAAAAGDAGSYDVVLMGTCGTLTSPPVSLTVNPVTAITTPPASQTKLIGQSVTFSVTANGANLSYQWRKGGHPIGGATGSSYTINAVQLSDAGSYDVVVTGACGTQTATAATLTVNCPSITVNPPSLPSAPLGMAYSQMLTATGGTAPYSFAVTGGALPGGLQLMENGLLTGMNNAVGTFNFTVTARDAYGCTGERTYTIATNSTPVLTPVPLSRAAGSTAATSTIATVSDVETPANQLQFALSSDGTNFGPTATLNGVTVTLTGINAAGQVTAMVTTTCMATSATFTLKVTDAGGTATTMPWTVTVPVNTPPVLSYTTQTVAVGQALTVNPASGPSDNGTLASIVLHSVTPALGGVSVNGASGVITIGNAAALGSYAIVIRATDNCGLTTDATFTLNITCPTIALSPSTLPNGVQGTAYNQTLTGAPVGTTYSFAVTTGSLPPGLTLASNGTLSGTPTAAGSYAFGVKATGFGACTSTQSYNLLISGTCATLTVNPMSLPGGSLNTNYEQTVSVTGGTAPYSFAITSGALPPGLSLNASTGVIIGPPTQGGTFSFRVTATGQGGCTGSRQYVLTIGCTTLTFTPTTLPPATQNSSYSQTLTVSPAGTYTFSLLLGSLPPGFMLSSAGVLSGMTNQTGTFNFTVKALGGACQGTKAYSLVIGSGAAASTPAGALLADYDGDGQSDPTLWSATEGVWRIVRSRDQQAETQRWGTAGDVALLGDYDGDGRSDLAVFRPGDATFYIKRSSDGGFLVKQWGLATDVPVPGDYDGDGRTDIAVFRPSEGNWYVWRSSDQQAAVTVWGAGYAPYHDIAVPGDYDGDGQTDLAVYRRSSGTWLIKRSSDGQFTTKAWGLNTDVPVVGDYDGDGRSDIAVWRGATGQWFVLRSTDQSYAVAVWGTTAVGDVPVPGDYDGDGRTDLAVWRAPTGQWHVWQSSSQSVTNKAQGQAGDTPVSSALKR